MARTVTIPENYEPNYEVWVNGAKYSYPAGATVEVPDGVADVIEHYYETLPKEDPQKGNMIIRKFVKEFPEKSRELPELSSSGGSITDKAFAESLWKNRKIAKYTNSFNDTVFEWRADGDETSKKFYTTGNQIVEILDGGIIRYYNDMGGGGGTITIPAHEEVNFEVDTPGTPFTTFFAYTRGFDGDGNTIKETLRLYVDKEKTFVARNEDLIKAFKHGNLMIEIETEDGSFVEVPMGDPVMFNDGFEVWASFDDNSFYTEEVDISEL